MTVLGDRELAFLHGSNAIEDITNIDYRVEPMASAPDGHVAAFLASQALAAAGTPLTLGMIGAWQGMITREQIQFGHALPAGASGTYRSPSYPHDVRVGRHHAPTFAEVPTLMAVWLAELDAHVGAFAGAGVTDIMTAETLGDVFQRFEAIHPFVDGNGRTGRLIANYVATVCGIPILVFRPEERPAFYAAHTSARAMRAFMGDKLREAIFDPFGGVLERLAREQACDVYPDLLVQRHELVAAQRRWRS